MFSHVCLGVRDFDRAFAFYQPLADELGYQLKFSDAKKGWAGWHQAPATRPLFIITRPFDGAPAHAGNGAMIAWLAASRDAVDRVFTLALALGAANEGNPGLRAHYHPDYYGAYFRDPDGNKICICCHEPEAEPSL